MEFYEFPNISPNESIILYRFLSEGLLVSDMLIDITISHNVQCCYPTKNTNNC